MMALLCLVLLADIVQFITDLWESKQQKCIDSELYYFSAYYKSGFF